MANLKLRRQQNVSGQFFVDSTCIDCGTCYWMAPEIFQDHSDQSAVYQQPKNVAERMQAFRALLSCPTGSIGVESKTPDSQQELIVARGQFPWALAPGVYHCGYHAESSFGATSYFIQTSVGNILVDSPRFMGDLVKKFEDMGGIQYHFLTHKDDIADTDKYQLHFGSQRIIHVDDLTTRGHRRDYEILVRGQDDLKLLGGQVKVIPVPGHTKGHMVLLYRDEFLFSGDHLSWSPQRQHLYAFRSACWYDWKEQIKSMEKLLNYSFSWVLPGHGYPWRAKDPLRGMAEAQEQLEKCIQWMQKSRP